MKKIILDKGGSDELTVHDSSTTIDFIIGDKTITGLDSPLRRVVNFDRSGQDGQIISSNYFGGRLISWTQTIVGADDDDHLANRKLLAAALAFERDSNGKAVTKTAEFTMNDDNVYTVEYVSRQPKLPHKLHNMTTGTIILECESESLDGAEATETIYLSSGGGFDITFTIPFDIDRTTGGQATITNSGDLDTYPIINLKNALSNPTISNQTTGKDLQLESVNTSAGETITIDMRNRTIYKGSQNYFSYKSSGSDFWALQPDANIIVFTDTTYNAAAYAEIVYSSAYSGI